jgi:predicted dinucleotide-binding enzyme
MTTAIIGLGTIGKIVSRLLVGGNERLIVAARDDEQALAFAQELGSNATAATITQAIASADNVVFTVWFDAMKELIAIHREQLRGKVVIDPSNPIKAENGKFVRTLPDGVSSGSIIAGLLPEGAHYVKAFGTLGAEALMKSAHRRPTPAVLFYAADDLLAAKTAERLIAAAGFEPARAGGTSAALRIEVFGDLHQFGALNGEVLNGKQARFAIQARA